MYTHPTYDRLRALHLSGMLYALEHQEQHPEIAAMPFLERLGILLVTDRQYGASDVRRNGAISKCLKWGLERC